MDKSIASRAQADYDVSGAKWGKVARFGIPLATAHLSGKGASLMFRGEYQHTIDAKGRIAIPAKFRGALAQGIVLVRGDEGCLYGYTPAVWDVKVDAIGKLDAPDDKRHRMQRWYISRSVDCELDAQGRIVVPPVMRQHAGLVTEATIAGTGDRFEIWDRARWQAELDEIEQEDFSQYRLPF